ncbi:MAG: STAS domain-containing protein [Candidatus Eremiobacteraeota bacterium]|nr:STAS domain-containing protein [Candidatus Eremiobacteraeota bacterium]
MEIIVAEQEGMVSLLIAGRLDGTSSGEFEKAVLPLASSGKALVLDCKGLLYISSAGIRSILMTARKVKASGASFSVRGLSGPVRETFLQSGFGSLITLEG